MTKSVPTVEHLNKLNNIINQLISIKIKFDNEVCALITLASLPNSWEPIKATFINLGNEKLKFSNSHESILVK